MIGSLPRLHRRRVVLIGALAGGALGAWISHLAVSRIPQSCSDVLLGICIAPTVNLLPIIAGVTLGLLGAMLLIYNPRDPHRGSTPASSSDT